MLFVSAKATNVCVIPSLVISVINGTGSTRAPGESLIPRFSAFSGHAGGGARYGTHEMCIRDSPFAATGARMITQTLHELRRRGGGLGLNTACAAGGLGVAMVLEVE